MGDKVFADTNIWIYALTESELKTDKIKRGNALQLFEELLEQVKHICVSIQVINECHWNFLRKFNISDRVAIKIIQENIIAILIVKNIGLSAYTLSNQIRYKYNLSYWDSLIIASALENDCSILYTEDMQHGQIIEDKLKIVNPFKEMQLKSIQ